MIHRGTFLVALLASSSLSACSPGSPVTGDSPLHSVTAPTPLPTPIPSAARFTLTGVVRDAHDRTPLGAVTVAIDEGANAPRMATSDGQGRFEFSDLEPGDLAVTVTRSGYASTTRVVSLATSTLIDVSLVSECVRPLTPALMATTVGASVAFSWPATAGATGYVLDAGIAPGVGNLLSVTLSGTSHVWTNVAPGTYYARVKATNACGPGGVSNEATVSVSSPAPEPGPSPSPSPTPTPTPTPPPGSWTGSLPATSGGTRPVCQATLPSAASCVNDIVGAPQAICADKRFSCSTGSGSCSQHGGVYCWRN